MNDKPHAEPTDIVDRRYHFVDALRGVAALAVLLFHVYEGPHKSVLDDFVPSSIGSVLHFGWMGVPIFFVISGFVIAKSLKNVDLSYGAIGRFILRRQLRLDPPYWATVGIVLASLLFTACATNQWSSLPNASVVIANLFYLQYILRIPSLVSVSWTLCIEIQFYLAIVIVFWLWQKARANLTLRLANIVWVFFLLATGLATLPELFLYDSKSGIAMTSPWLLGYWCMFMCGTWVYMSLVGVIPHWPVVLLLTCAMTAGIVRNEQSLSAAAITAALIYFLGLTGRLHVWGKQGALQFLGRISYSLYLVHWTVSYRIMNFTIIRWPNSTKIAVISVLLAICASFFFAVLLHYLVESPSIRFANRFKVRNSEKKRSPSDYIADEAASFPAVRGQSDS